MINVHGESAQDERKTSMSHSSESPGTHPKPLDGMRVLDLSRALSGPFCALILGDLGADVCKVEPAPGGDMIREWGPFDHGESVYYLSGNRNKRGIAVNFRSDEGIALLREMALKSDVLVENFKPGTLKAMGLDPEELRRENPKLIVASLTGFGSTGPLAQRPGFDQIAQGCSGFMSLTGTPETGPTRVGVAIGDLTSGMWLTIGILAAWIQRERTGQSQAVETSLLASLVSLLSVQGQRYLSLSQVAAPSGNDHTVIAPYGVFRAQDGDLNIAAATQEMWVRLCHVIGAVQLVTDERFIDNAARAAHRHELRELIEARLKTKSRSEWTAQLIDAGVPTGPINSLAEAIDDEQVRHLSMVEAISHPIYGEIRQISNPLRMSGSPQGWVSRAPPAFGEHTRQVLTEYGFDARQIADWEQRGVIVQNAAPELQATELHA
jgi:crotonobetainyl-CoA:carnitine CoA-transferase CaiB-like acyl-CoA transferase